MSIFIPDYIQNLQTYKAGKPIEELAREKGLTRIVKLASNENPLGPSPKAIEAIQNALQYLHRYSDPACYMLRHVLSGYFDVPYEKIFAASGSDAILQYIINAFSVEGDELVSSHGSFIGWYVNADKLNRKSILVTQTEDYRIDLNKIANAITPKTRIVYLANPNNPTGTIFTKKEFEDFLKKVPNNVLVVLDEAYTVYAKKNEDYPDGLNYENDNLIVLRTFSKSFGLAGLRIGISFANEEITKQLFKVKLPFEPNQLAQTATIAALEDFEFIEKTLETNRISMSMLRKFFNENNVKVTDSSANFFLMIFDNENLAASFSNLCLDRGLILRHVASFGFPNGVRINSGTIEETEFAILVMESVLKEMSIIANITNANIL